MLLKILYHQSNMAVNTFYLKITGTSFVNVMSCYSQVGFEKTKNKIDWSDVSVSCDYLT